MLRTVLMRSATFLALLVSGIQPATSHASELVPSVTISPASVVRGKMATLNGSNFTPRNWVFIYWQRPDGTTGNNWVYTTPSRTFSFTLGFAASHGVGTEWISAYDYSTGQWAPFVAVTVKSSSGAASSQITVVPNPVIAGSDSTATGQGFSRSNWVWITWQRPNGTTNGTWLQTSASGTFSLSLSFLPTNGCGTEFLWAYDYGTNAWTEPYTVVVNGC